VSGTTESLSRKIAGAQDLKAVVRSMKALAASSLGQYERAIESLDDYYRTVELGLSACLRQVRPAPHTSPRMPASVQPVGAVMFGSDQGLVGRFNAVLMEFALGKLEGLPGKTKQIWAVGERMGALVTDAGPLAPCVLPVPNSIDAITALVGRILIEIQAARDRGGVGEIHIFYNHPMAAALYEPVGKRLLPLDRLWQDKLAALPWPTKNLPEIIEGAAPTLDAFIREYLFVSLFQACAESLASENASRLAAMQRAETNIEEILDGLTRRFHRDRQKSIDEELFEVVSGYESLARRSTTSPPLERARPPVHQNKSR
jgi:F-type H+-transporting ATPase subunit gamma